MTDKLKAPLFAIGQRVFLREFGYLGTVIYISIGAPGAIIYKVRWGSTASWVCEDELEAA